MTFLEARKFVKHNHGGIVQEQMLALLDAVERGLEAAGVPSPQPESETSAASTTAFATTPNAATGRVDPSGEDSDRSRAPSSPSAGWQNTTTAPKNQADLPELPFSSLTRLEVINENGRAFTRWDCAIEASVQDQGRTLKLFVKPLPLPPESR